MNYCEQLSNELKAQISNGSAPFKFIPDNIGEITYCFSTNIREKAYTSAERNKKLLKWGAFCILIPVLCWLIFNNSPIFDTIVSIIGVIVFVKSVLNLSKFKGTDYFVGTKGFSKVDFEKTRENIVSKDTHLYDEFSQLTTGETYKKQNYSYVGTDYFFGFFSKPDKENRVRLLIDVGGTYNQEKPSDDMVDAEYTFWKNVESQWSLHKLEELKNMSPDENVTFAVIHTKDNNSGFFATPYITITPESLIFGDRVYNRDTLT